MLEVSSAGQTFSLKEGDSGDVYCRGISTRALLFTPRMYHVNIGEKCSSILIRLNQ